MSFAAAFKGRSVFITGHTGFKGSWLAIWLARLGATVTGYSLAPPTNPSNFAASSVRDCLSVHHEADIRNGRKLGAAIAASRPDVVFHLAAQALVRKSYRDPFLTYEVNAMGTLNLLECLRTSGRPAVVVIVTSDKCYENSGNYPPHSENDSLGGADPYSGSKAAAEIVAGSYRSSFFPPDHIAHHGMKIATVRAGNVIGGGDWAEDRIVPDIVKAFSSGKTASIRNPRSIRPWQHVLNPLNGYLTLASRMLESDDPGLCSGWNFGPAGASESTAADIANELSASWPGTSWRAAGSNGEPAEEPCLRLSIAKAVSKLGWEPHWNFDQAIARTCGWYKAFYDAPERSSYELCVNDIADYETDAAAGSQRPAAGPSYVHAR
ncbi:MAG: CDP-glucose 4,6-dehydratase [Acidobacteriota bacterium]|nr:CDP-glucose 4,6-dehydratase [Acidobacteriota bacterium]